ncbi:site-specific integrase [Streptomyces sp. YGL11-2]|uniref:site-specific integrase n=1 Tax=Streptomyces sp. YGL11-2 TaxID=3414028 RepID=UPI003CE7E933
MINRTHGPLFLTGRKAPAGTSTLDVCPENGRARLSYRRAEEVFEENTRLLANPQPFGVVREGAVAEPVQGPAVQVLTVVREGKRSSLRADSAGRHAAHGVMSAPAAFPGHVVRMR